MLFLFTSYSSVLVFGAKAKEAKRSKDIPRPPTPEPPKTTNTDLEKLKNENRTLTNQNLELNSEIRKIHTQLDEYESECRHYKDELKTLRYGFNLLRLSLSHKYSFLNLLKVVNWIIWKQRMKDYENGLPKL